MVNINTPFKILCTIFSIFYYVSSNMKKPEKETCLKIIYSTKKNLKAMYKKNV